MKRVLFSCLLGAMLLSTTLIPLLPASDFVLPSQADVRVCFSPDGKCAGLLTTEITQAKKEILVMTYSMGSPAMARALIAAHQAGVRVELLIDKSGREEGYTPVVMMANAGIPVWLDTAHGVMNHRVVIIDERTVLTGSYGFNTASEAQNAENLVVISSEAVARAYRNDWLAHRQHSEKY